MIDVMVFVLGHGLKMGITFFVSSHGTEVDITVFVSSKSWAQNGHKCCLF